jgi:hypothetical protein
MAQVVLWESGSVMFEVALHWALGIAGSETYLTLAKEERANGNFVERRWSRIRAGLV